MAVVEILDISLTETVSARLRGHYLRAVPGTLNTAHTMEITGWGAGPGMFGRRCRTGKQLQCVPTRPGKYPQPGCGSDLSWCDGSRLERL